MKFPDNIRVYGDQSYRGKCPSETAEQVTLFNRVRKLPVIGELVLHPRNEGKRTHAQTARHCAEGLTPGASDIIIPGNPAFVCELKRRDHTQSHWEKGQQNYLISAQAAGAFVCIALGADAAEEAIREWLTYLTI